MAKISGPRTAGPATAGTAHALFRGVNGRDGRTERRSSERQVTGSAMDVSRIEHENLFRQVDEVLRRVARVELELRQQDARIEAIENATGIASRNPKRSK